MKKSSILILVICAVFLFAGVASAASPRIKMSGVVGLVKEIQLIKSKISSLKKSVASLKTSVASLRITVSDLESNKVSTSDPTWEAQDGVISVAPSACYSTDTGITLTDNAVYVADNEVAHVYCPLQLPQGATITKWTAYITENSETENLVVDVLKVSNSESHATTYLADILTYMEEPGYLIMEQEPATPQIIDNDTGFYTVDVFFDRGDGTNIMFHGLKINYTFTNPY